MVVEELTRAGIPSDAVHSVDVCSARMQFPIGDLVLTVERNGKHGSHIELERKTVGVHRLEQTSIAQLIVSLSHAMEWLKENDK
jgi:hypothetical protein